MRRTSFAIAILILSTLACTLTSSNVQPTAAPASKPNITITQPTTGTTFTVNDTVTVQVEASDPEGSGVTRVDLLVNGVIVDSQTSQDPLGENSLSVLLDYIAAVANPNLVLTARAYRGAEQSDPATVSVVINPRDGDNDSSGGSNNTPVSAPATLDPVCRARVDSSELNFREGPSTNYQIYFRFSLGDEPPVVGRLSDNSWWEVTSGGFRGWVSGAYTTLFGDCSNIPATTPPASPTPAASKTPTPAPNAPADLIISTFAGSTSIDLVGGEAVASYIIQVKNVGGTAVGAFNVSLLFPDGRSWDYTIASLAPGAAATVEGVSVTFSTPGTYRLEVLVDSSANIAESNEDNNREFKDVVVSDKPLPEVR